MSQTVLPDASSDGGARILPLEGDPDPDLSSIALNEEELRELYRLMACTRRADRQATALQRQG